MNKRIFLTAAVALICLSCAKEQITEQPQGKVDEEIINPQNENQNGQEGEAITLRVGLSPDTKITTVYDGEAAKVKLTWAAEDKLVITFGTYTEIWTLKAESVGKKQGEFQFTSGTPGEYTDNTKLTNGETMNVAYEGNSTDWSEQDGTAENLPLVLTATDVTYNSEGTEFSLDSKLTYFHIIINNPATSNAGEALYLPHAYLHSNNSSVVFKKNPTEAGIITITRPASATFDFSADGTPSSTIDIFAAAMVEGTTKNVKNAVE